MAVMNRLDVPVGTSRRPNSRPNRDPRRRCANRQEPPPSAAQLATVRRGPVRAEKRRSGQFVL